jgi:hypothetical protein
MEAAVSSELFVTSSHTTQRHILAGSNIHIFYRRENRKSRKIVAYF